jgi:hypothetical protein
MKITRRAFILGAAFFAVAGVPLGYRWLRTLEGDAEILVRALCDLFVPGHDEVPGAVALGIDREVADAFRATRRGRLRLLLLGRDLADVGFVGLSVADQRAFLRSELTVAATGGAVPRRAAAIDEAYRECMRRYLIREETWGAIRYRTPQPHGYPDYAECVTG